MSSSNPLIGSDARRKEASFSYLSTRGDDYDSSTGIVEKAAPGRWRTFINGELTNISKQQKYKLSHK